ncbi:MAG: PepSY-like domain-containing protein [Bacteroidaceae bacterium]|nr:PepSY-like domain-containing protein [Bacteroidaceae bacterium]
MKKSSLLCALVAILATLTFQTVQAQDYKNLPQNIKAYIGRHFKGYTISHYEKDREILDVEYKVYISKSSSMFKLDFDKNGVVEDIESTDDRTPLPSSVLPVKITQHVKSKFPQAKIIEWKRKKNTQVVELTNDMELVFNSKGDFLRIDD